MFAVYLFHAESQGIAFIKGTEHLLIGRYGLNPASYFIVNAFLLFLGAMILDICTRRLVEMAISRLANKRGGQN